ncbi:MAG: CBS domain-containing protein [Bacteroides sp.]|jgi:predicted transcriptional regulator|nr:CBS domain-containing protein [Bacteroides sp.]
MLAKDLLSDLVIPLKTSDEAASALAWMDELRISHMPIVNNEKFLGLVSEADILNLNALDEPLGNHKLSLTRPYVLHYQHFYDVIRLIATQKLSLVPVLDPKENYLGCITLSRVVEEMANISSVEQPGGIIVLEVNDHDYSLSEIARIVESNDAKVLSSYVNSFPESTRLEVTIKVNRIDLSSILQTFNRYNYSILASFSEESKFGELLNDRFESLMNYLNI